MFEGRGKFSWERQGINKGGMQKFVQNNFIPSYDLFPPGWYILAGPKGRCPQQETKD
jgi:hypothetical protein